MSIIRDLFCDDDVQAQNGQLTQPGQANPVKVIGLPAMVSLTLSVCTSAWVDAFSGHLAEHAPYYFGAVTGGLVAFAAAVYTHSKAAK
jgi:hypothetical protein